MSLILQKKECIFVTFILSEGHFPKLFFISIYSVLNKLSGYIYIYISKNFISYTFLLAFKILESLQCIFNLVYGWPKTFNFLYVHVWLLHFLRNPVIPQMSCVNDMTVEKQVWFLFININQHICTLIEFVILRAKIPKN